MSSHRYPAILNTLPDAKPCKPGEWVVDQQYIIDHRGQAIVQWGSYTSRKNANLIVLAKRFEKELRALAAGPRSSPSPTILQTGA